MTDRIDLDELDTDGSPDDDQGNPGDWFWGAGTDPPESSTETTASGTDAPSEDRVAGRATDTADSHDAAADPHRSAAEAGGPDVDGDTRESPVPHVPRPNKDRPVGIPVASGGAGSGPSQGTEAGAPGEMASGGPHGGGVDDMTMAITYNAFRRLERPRAVAATAREWADWIGIVGREDAHVLNKFQRDEGLDLDFFNGTGTGPGERLAAIDEHSMFFADRMVVVGVEGRDEPIADTAGWEFVPLDGAAAKADWAIRDVDRSPDG